MAEEIVDAGLAEDDFDLAFEAAANTELELTDSLEEPGIDETETDGPEVEEPKAEEPEVEEPEVEEPKAEEPKVEEPKAEEPKKEAPAVDPVAESKAAEDAKAAADAALAEALAKETPTAEEQALIDRVHEDFPEIAKVAEIQQRVLLAKMENLLTAKLGEASNKFEQRLAPAEAVVNKVAQTEHERAILEAHSDAFAILPDVEKWVATQPSFLQNTYNTILDSGSATEIIEMFNVFKGTTAEAAKPGPTAEELAAQEEKKRAKELKLQAQEGVRGRRTNTSTAVDPDDFDGAFEKFAATA
jgi:hypothetical protein